MPLAGDSILVTPGSGATLATHTQGSKEHETWIKAMEGGNALASLPTYYAWQNGSTPAVGRYHWALFNGSGSGKLVIVTHLFISNLQLSNVAVSNLELQTWRTTAQSGGTAITPVKADTANAAVASQILIATQPTTLTEDVQVYEAAPYYEEIGGSDGSSMHIYFQLINYAAANEDRTGMPTEPRGRQFQVLREGEGICLKQSAGATAGSIGIFGVFCVI